MLVIGGDGHNHVHVHCAPFTAQPSPPMVSAPMGRATPGHTVTFTCKSNSFSPRNVILRWFKDGNELRASQTSVDPEGDSPSYSVSSTVTVPLARGDIRSQVICQVEHVTLKGGPLRGTANLSEIIRGRCPSHPAPAHTWLLPSKSAPRPAIFSDLISLKSNS